MKTGFVIEGAAALERNLATLDARLQKTVVRQAVRAAQRPMLQEAKSNASRLGSGVEHHGRDMSALLARNIVIRAPRRQRRGSYSLHVQMRRDVPEFISGKYYIPAAIEFGHGADKAKAARPFMRPAADRTIEQTKRILAQELNSGILREAIRGRYR